MSRRRRTTEEDDLEEIRKGFEMFDDIALNKEKVYKSIFDMNDNNKDGNVNSLELANILKAININITDEEIKEIMTEIDLEGKGEINYEEFISILNRREKDVDSEEELLKAFKVFDKEGNGLININEMKHIMLTSGNNLSESEINNMLTEADTDMDGYINYEEFIRSILAK